MLVERGEWVSGQLSGELLKIQGHIHMVEEKVKAVKGCIQKHPGENLPKENEQEIEKDGVLN